MNKKERQEEFLLSNIAYCDKQIEEIKLQRLAAYKAFTSKIDQYEKCKENILLQIKETLS